MPNIATPSGQMQVTGTTAGSFIGNASPMFTTVNLKMGAGFPIAGGTYSLITFSPGAATGVDATDFTLGNVGDITPANYLAVFSVDADSVDVTLTAVPEVSSFLLPAFGAAAHFAYRRRISRATAPAIA